MEMKALCIADLHSEETCIEYARKFLEAEKPEIVLIAGDFTTNGPLDFVEDVLEVFKDVKTLAVHGNNDPMRVKNFLIEKKVSVHARAEEYHGLRFVGYGGSPPTPFSTAIEYPEAIIEKDLMHLTDANTILLTHAPPFKTKADCLRDGKHVGSHAVSNVIYAKKPLACFCGHVHETQGYETILRTKIFKIPPLMNGRALVVDLKTWEWKKIVA